ncbi:MAG: J domain-containing protein [Deltaproteobacteria bacterium]|nr:J domain-containing protein [Deltaproteobacteria bacterium]
MSVVRDDTDRNNANCSRRWWPLATLVDVVIFSALFSFSFHAWDWMMFSVPALFALSLSRVTLPIYSLGVIGMSGGIFWSFGSSFVRELSRPHSVVGLVAIWSIAAIIGLGLLYLAVGMIGWGRSYGRADASVLISEQSTKQTTEPISVEAVTEDPHQILGLSSDSSPDAVRSAYLKEIQLYHPDRVEHLGSELRRLAHERSIQIQRAYEKLRAP